MREILGDIVSQLSVTNEIDGGLHFHLFTRLELLIYINVDGLPQLMPRDLSRLSRLPHRRYHGEGNTSVPTMLPAITQASAGWIVLEVEWLWNQAAERTR